MLGKLSLPVCVLLLILVSVSGDATTTPEVAVEIGDSVSLNCATADTTEGNVTWYHNSRLVATDQSRFNVHQSAILFLQNATLADSGSYSCVTGTNVTLQSYSVVIGLPPRGPEIFQCRSYDFALVTCEWSRIPETHLRTEVMCEFTTEHRITNTTTWSRCRHFSASSGLQEFYDLPQFHVRLVLQNSLGVLFHSPEDGEFRVRDHTTPHPPINVKIKATGNCHGESFLNMTWQNPPSIPGNRINEYLGDFELELTARSGQTENMNYVGWQPTLCMAWSSNKRMDETYCVRLRFLSPKKGSWSERACSLSSPDEIACERGGRVQLACPGTGRPSTARNETAVAWYHNNTVMPEETDAFLSITNASWEDAGNYSCMQQGEAKVASYNVMIGSKPRSIPLECSSNDFENIICKWDPALETNLPTIVVCGYAQGYGQPLSYTSCPNFSARSGVLQFTGIMELVVLLHFANALGSQDQYPSVLPFRVLHETRPSAPIFNVNVTSTCERGSWLNVVWTIPFSSARRVGNYLLEEENEFEEHQNSVDLFYKLKSTSIPASVCNTEYCVRMKTISQYRREGPWSKQICIKTPRTVPNIVTTHENYSDEIVKGKGLRHVNVTWNVTQNKNMPYQGLSGFRVQIVSSKSNRTAFLNLSEQFSTSLVHNKFSMILPGLSVKEKYLVYLSPFNTAGLSRTRKFTIASVKMDPGTGHKRLLLMTIPIVILLAITLIFALLGCGYQRIKKDSQHIPDPVYPKIFQIKPLARPEPEVFDQLVCSPENKEKCAAQISSMVSQDKEIYPLLEQTDFDISPNNQTYCKLSMQHSEPPFKLHMATDVENCDYYPFDAEVSVKHLSVDEGIYVGYLSSSSQRSGDESSDQDQYQSLSFKGPPFGGQCGLTDDSGGPVGDIGEGGMDSGCIYSSLAQCTDEESCESSNFIDADEENSLPSMQTACAHRSHQASDTVAADPFWMANKLETPGLEPYVMAPSGQWEGPAVGNLSRPSLGQDHGVTALIHSKLSINEKTSPILAPLSEKISDYVTCDDIASMHIGGKADCGDNIHRKPHSLQSSPQHTIRDHFSALSSAQWLPTPELGSKMPSNLQAAYVDSRDIPPSPSLQRSSSESSSHPHSETNLTSLQQDETTSAAFKTSCRPPPIAGESYRVSPGVLHKMLIPSSSGYVSKDS